MLSAEIPRTDVQSPFPPRKLKSPWRTMESAPRDRLILLRTRWEGELSALTGRYVKVHGGFCTLPMNGQVEIPIFANAWSELPDLHAPVTFD